MTVLAVPPTQTFERGDRIYMVSPVQVFQPSDAQIEELAFATQVKKAAPNENIMWLRGQYVEADNPNANGAQWRADELAVKSLTPMLMPVTVMHDPRTAVGTIADVKLLTPEKDGVPRARIDTVLALWGHRFPDAVNEAQENARAGTLMQSMECYSPWYECSECGSVYHKLPLGAEKAMWCPHLRASDPSAGYVAQTSNASRILGDVTFTGTGLIYGSRGARGAYSEAHLEQFQDELASYHANVHTSTSVTQRSGTRMGLVQIEDTELAALRQERDAAKAEAAKVPTLTQEKAEAERAAEAAEAAKVKAEQERDQAKAEVTAAQEERAKAETKERRWNSLGGEFVAKLGDFTKSRLQEQAAALSDEDWDARLKEIEETAGVKRDAKAETNGGGGTETARTLLDPPDFKPEEVASTVPVGGGSAATITAPDRLEQRQVIGALGGLFKR